MAADLGAESVGGAGAGVLVLVLIVGIGFGMMIQRFTRSGRDLKGARAFAKTAGKTHWRVSFPRLVLWGFLAVCAVLAIFRVMFAG
jgi:hypothetical protein